jgi:hypothetical protein
VRGKTSVEKRSKKAEKARSMAAEEELRATGRQKKRKARQLTL